MFDTYNPEVNSYFVGVIYREKDNAIINVYKTEAETMAAYAALPDVSGICWCMFNLGVYFNDMQETGYYLSELKEKHPEEFKAWLSTRDDLHQVPY